MQKIRLAVIGAGMAWERLHYPAIQELNDKYAVVAICDAHRERAERMGQHIGLSNEDIYTDHRELLKRNDIDTVDILVPIPQNYDVSLDAAKKGKNIICEKPLADNMEDALRYISMAQKYKVSIMIAENYRYNEEVNKIHEIINSGEIGDVIYFIMNHVISFPAQMTQDDFYAREWRQHPEFRGGNFLDATIHELAALHHIFGPVNSVFAFGKPQKEDYSPYLYINASLKFSSGVIGNYSYYTDGVETQRPLIGLRIFGSEGMIYLEERSCGIINLTKKDGTSEQIPYRPMRGYYNEFLNFYNSLTGKEKIAVTPEVEFGDVELIFDILDAIEEENMNFVERWPTYEEEGDAPYAYH